jgi:hypothetical protein
MADRPRLSLTQEGLAAAADLCHRPWRHAVRPLDPAQPCVDAEDPAAVVLDQPLRLEARDSEGVRHSDHDLELEIYRSGDEINLMLSWVEDEEAPILWHGSHPVWLQSSDGRPADRPKGAQALESLCRRLRALIAGD